MRLPKIILPKIILMVLCVSACASENLVAVDMCGDNTQGAIASIQMKTGTGYAEHHLCRFPVGSTCDELKKSHHVEIVENRMLHSRCAYK